MLESDTDYRKILSEYLHLVGYQRVPLATKCGIDLDEIGVLFNIHRLLSKTQ